jgi:hypothetical protein
MPRARPEKGCNEFPLILPLLLAVLKEAKAVVGTGRLKHEPREAKAAAGRRATPAAVAARRLLTMTVAKRRKCTAALGIRGR